jgi:uncharacterized protein
MQERRLTTFFALTFLWSWVIWAPLVLAGLGIIPLDAELVMRLAMPAAMLGAFGPAFGACLSIWTLDGLPALKQFLRRFTSLRFGWKAWTAIFVVLGALNVIAWYAPELLGDVRLPMLLPTAAVFPIWWLLMVLLGGGQEEVGWRGYILEPLENRYGLWGGNIVLGLVWTLWHLPLWFMPGSSQEHMPFVAFALGNIGLCFFFSWVLKASGGRPLAGLIAHGTNNAFIALFPTIVLQPDALQTRWWIHQTLLLVVGALFMLRLTRRGATDRARGARAGPSGPMPS